MIINERPQIERFGNIRFYNDNVDNGVCGWKDNYEHVWTRLLFNWQETSRWTRTLRMFIICISEYDDVVMKDICYVP